MEFRKVIYADALIQTDLATIRADKQRQIEWLDKIDTAVHELQPQVEATVVLDRVAVASSQLRAELRRPLRRKSHISTAWLNLIAHLLFEVRGDDAVKMGEGRKDELIRLFTDFVEHL